MPTEKPRVYITFEFDEFDKILKAGGISARPKDTALLMIRQRLELMKAGWDFQTGEEMFLILKTICQLTDKEIDGLKKFLGGRLLKGGEAEAVTKKPARKAN